jgi:hypothetical protein
MVEYGRPQLAGISILISRMGTLIHSRPFRVKQIVRCSPERTISLICIDFQSTETSVPRHFSDTNLPLSPFFTPLLCCTRRASARCDW